VNLLFQFACTEDFNNCKVLTTVTYYFITVIRVLLKIVNLCVKFSHKHAAHENRPFLIAEKFSEQVSYAFTLLDTAQ
jgi:hypothetical protein